MRVHGGTLRRAGRVYTPAEQAPGGTSYLRRPQRATGSLGASREPLLPGSVWNSSGATGAAPRRFNGLESDRWTGPGSGGVGAGATGARISGTAADGDDRVRIAWVRLVQPDWPAG